MANTWRTAKSLEVLRRQFNKAYPNRDKTSDGSIGDAKHQSRSSDHNPWVKDSNGVGVVRARDFDEDGLPLWEIVKNIVALGRAGDPRLNPDGYVIYEGRIWSAAKDWRERAYTGENAHKHHAHVSVSTRQKGYDDDRAWDVLPHPAAKAAQSPSKAREDRWLGLSNPPMQGEDVRGVQRALVQAGTFDGEPDAVYAMGTAQALKAFQDKAGIAERGCGPETWKALRKVVHGA